LQTNGTGPSTSAVTQYTTFSRAFCVISGAQLTQIVLGVVTPPTVKAGSSEIKVVLTWGPEPTYDSDLDLQSMFGTSQTKCQVGFFQLQCDNDNVFSAGDYKGGGLGGETVTVVILKQAIYHFFVGQYFPLGAPNVNSFVNTGAQVDVYVSGIAYPVATFDLPSSDPNGLAASLTDRYWSVFCIDGSKGLFVNPTNLFSGSPWMNPLLTCGS